jgi:hypothetical protein
MSRFKAKAGARQNHIAQRRRERSQSTVAQPSVADRRRAAAQCRRIALALALTGSEAAQ